MRTSTLTVILSATIAIFTVVSFSPHQFQERFVFHCHSKGFQLLSKTRDSIILQDYLVKFLEFFLVKFYKLGSIFVGQDVSKGLWNSRLYSDGDIFFNEIFNHGKVIPVIINVKFYLPDCQLYFFKITQEVFSVTFPPIYLVALILKPLQPDLLLFICFYDFMLLRLYKTG